MIKNIPWENGPTNHDKTQILHFDNWVLKFIVQFPFIRTFLQMKHGIQQLDEPSDSWCTTNNITIIRKPQSSPPEGIQISWDLQPVVLRDQQFSGFQPEAV